MLNELSTRDLVKEYNARSTKPIGQWKGSKGALIKKIEALPAAKPTPHTKGNGTTKEKAEKPKRVKIADVVLNMMKKGESDEKILKFIRDNYPKARTTQFSLDWYRWKYHRAGLI